MFSLCESVCVSSWQNVVLDTTFVTGTNKEDILINLPVYMSAVLSLGYRSPDFFFQCDLNDFLSCVDDL